MRSNSLQRLAVFVLAALAMLSALVPWYSSRLQEHSLKKSESGLRVEAVHDAQRSVTLNPFSADALFVLAGAEQRLGRTTSARSALIRATEIQPLNYQAWEQLATYERDHWEQFAEAETHFEKAVQLNPLDRQLRQRAGLPES